MNLNISDHTWLPLQRLVQKASRPRVFLVENDDEVRGAIQTSFEDDGNDVVSFDDGEQVMECMDLVSRDVLRPPDLIAMSLFMRGRSGIELLERFRRDGWGTPVVIVTWCISLDVLHRAERAGAAAVVEKPIKPSELRRAAMLARVVPPLSRGYSQ